MTPQTPRKTPVARFLAIAAALVLVIGGTLASRDLMPRRTSDISSSAKTTTYTETSGTGVYRAKVAASADGDAAYYASEEAAAPQVYASYDSSVSGEAVSNANAAPAVDTRKLVYTVSMSIVCDDLDASVGTLTSSCTGLGGYVASSSESTYRSTRSASMTLRIPSSALDTFLESVGDTGKISSRSIDVNDVTDSYFDITSRLDSQKALLARMQELAAKATSIKDLIEIESKMASTQAEIDSYTGTLNRMDNQIAYATIYIDLRQKSPETSVTDKELTFGERIVWAVKNSFTAFGTFMQDSVIFIIAILPFAVLIAVAVVVLRIIIRKKRSRKISKPEA